MKTIEELCLEIESPRFAAAVNIASDLRTFERGVNTQPETRELIAQMHHTETQTWIGEHARRLIVNAATSSEEPVEDTAVAVYLLLLAQHEEAHAEQIATTLTDLQPWWWARKVADRILSSSRSAGVLTRGAPS